LDNFEGSHDTARGSDINLVSEAFRPLLEYFESAFEGSIISTQKRLFGEVHSNLFCNSDVGEKHELFYQCASIVESRLVTVDGTAGLVQGEDQLRCVGRNGTVFESTFPQDLRDVMQELNVMLDR
jgi:hypothetical protein